MSAQPELITVQRQALEAVLNRNRGLALCVEVLGDDEDARLCETIASQFPEERRFHAADLFYSEVPETWRDYECKAFEFLGEVARLADIPAASNVFLVWDDASYKSFRLQFSALLKHISELLLPPHLYVLANDLEWCACIRSEGYMWFSFRTMAAPDCAA